MNKQFIIFIIFAVAAALGFIFVWPRYQNLTNLNLNIVEREEELKSQEDYFSKVREVSSQLSELDESLVKIKSALPDDPELASLFNFFQIKAGESGLIFQDIDLSGVLESKENKFREIKASMELTGSYTALKTFLSAIETSSRVIEVVNLQLEPPTEEREDASYRLDVLTRSY